MIVIWYELSIDGRPMVDMSVIQIYQIYLYKKSFGRHASAGAIVNKIIENI